MNVVDTIQFALILAGLLFSIISGRKFAKNQKKVEADWKKFVEQRKELYRQLTDSQKFEEDFEKTAYAREMLDAKRTTMPREDAGPPAVVHRPPLRGKQPGHMNAIRKQQWRPPVRRNPNLPEDS